MELAQNAVLKPSEDISLVNPRGESRIVVGNNSFEHLSRILSQYSTIGFQATNFSLAEHIMIDMFDMLCYLGSSSSAPEPTSSLHEQLFTSSSLESKQNFDCSTTKCNIYLGATANLFSTGVRESIAFLCKEKLITHLIVSGGAIEHDIRRVLTQYTLTGYTSEKKSLNHNDKDFSFSNQHLDPSLSSIGNIAYSSTCDRLREVLKVLLVNAWKLQQKERTKNSQESGSETYSDRCSWSWSPSRFWKEAGLILPEILGSEKKAEETVLFQAAKNGIPIFSPSFVDGEIMLVYQELISSGTSEVSMTANPLQIDLVQDIDAINRSAIQASSTGMIILGGGIVKHHICNANLMRNGADFAVFINSAQEFDGSDAGARPDEAISWGKIKSSSRYVKLYTEVTLVFPILTALSAAKIAIKKRDEAKKALLEACI